MNNNELIDLLKKIDENLDDKSIEDLIKLSKTDVTICHLAIKKINAYKLKKHYDKIFKVLKIHVKNELEVALIDIGVLYQKGFLGVKKDIDEAIKYFEEAIKLHNSGIACQSIGAIYYYGVDKKQDYEKAFYYLKKGADFNYVDSQIGLAKMYAEGIYVEQNYVMASYYFEKAYDSGRTDLACLIGNIYNPVNNILNDEEQAIEWYSKGCDNNDGICFALLGALYEDMGEDYYKLAFECYEKGAKLHNPLSCFLTGLSLIDGKIVVKNKSLAKAYLHESLKLGYSDAKEVLKQLGDDIQEGNSVNYSNDSSVEVYLNTTTFSGFEKIESDRITKQRLEQEHNEKRLKAAAAATGMSGLIDTKSGIIQDKNGNEMYISGDFIIQKNGDILEFNEGMNSVYNPKTGEMTCLSNLGNSIYNWENGKMSYSSGNYIDSE